MHIMSHEDLELFYDGKIPEPALALAGMVSRTPRTLEDEKANALLVAVENLSAARREFDLRRATLGKANKAAARDRREIKAGIAAWTMGIESQKTELRLLNKARGALRRAQKALDALFV